MRFVNPLVFVSDLERSRRFYVEVMGLTVKEQDGGVVIFEGGFAVHQGEALQQTVWGDIEQPGGPYGRRNVLLYFEDTNLDRVFETIAPHVQLIHPIRTEAWGQRVFRFHDPDGHAIEIGEPME
ncbi:VOC family protein [Pelagibacterium halotolerans]|uniref:VOC family protein n=1 Tax=Pelagibacterium halotolerans TaxID=531813 RepID=UPI00384C8C0B